jgi:D-ribose pyranose/furanose isomerase RbsD
MEYYSAIKNNEFMKFLCKWMYLEGIILSEVTQSQKNSHDMHSLITQKIRIPKLPKLQFAKHMKLKKKEDQSVDNSFILRMGNKISKEGVTETKFGAETEGRTIQRLPHPEILP